LVCHSFRFKRKEHLKGRKEIREVFGKGRRFSCQGAKLFILENDLQYNRICFTFTRNFGNAVIRNHEKRLGREAYRLLKHRLSGGYDVILLIYPGSEKSASLEAGAFEHRAKQLESLFKKAGLLI